MTANDREASSGNDKNVLESDYGDGYTTLEIH